MRVLLDHDVPHGLRPEFPDEYEVVTAQYQGWADLDNGDLLQAAEGEYTVLVTLDTNLVHQQEVGTRDIGIVIIDVHPIVPDHLERQMGKVRSALTIAAEGQRTVVVWEGGIDLLSSQ
jgi:predicted nuclease of predicted toxin-antitoxin system